MARRISPEGEIRVQETHSSISTKRNMSARVTPLRLAKSGPDDQAKELAVGNLDVGVVRVSEESKTSSQVTGEVEFVEFTTEQAQLTAHSPDRSIRSATMDSHSAREVSQAHVKIVLFDVGTPRSPMLQRHSEKRANRDSYVVTGDGEEVSVHVPAGTGLGFEVQITSDDEKNVVVVGASAPVVSRNGIHIKVEAGKENHIVFQGD